MDETGLLNKTVCPRCKRFALLVKGDRKMVLDYHDDIPPCRRLCRASRKTLAAARRLQPLKEI